MENGDKNRKIKSEKLCRRIRGGCESESQSGGGLFGKDWEVFVARYDSEKGKYVSSTFCCEAALS